MEVAPILLTFCLTNDWLEFSNNNSDDMTDWGSLKKFVILSLIFHISLMVLFKIKNFGQEKELAQVVNVTYVEKEIKSWP